MERMEHLLRMANVDCGLANGIPRVTASRKADWDTGASPSTTKVTLLFDHIGPYHESRAIHAGRFVDLQVVQWVPKSADYAWEQRAGNERLRVSTVLDGPSASYRERLMRFAQTIESTDPDVVFVNGWNDYGSALALRWCYEHHVPAVVMSESQAIDFPRRWPIERVKRSILRFYAAALCGGRTHAQYLQTLGMDPSQIFIGYDVVDNEYFAAKANEARRNPSRFRRALDLPEQYALVCARFIPKKNLPFVLRGFARVRARSGNRDWKLVLMGDGPLRPLLLRLVDELGMGDAVVLPGFVQYDQIPYYFGLASLLMHASTTEQWGLVVNEAMAAGLPVLVSDRCGSATELVRDGVNGFAFDPFDEERFVELLAAMLEDPDRLARMGEASRRIVADWGPDRFGRGVAEAARTALGRPAPQVSQADRLMLFALSRR